jgi:D-alanyl-D-alanine carboxypeptidase
MIEAPRTHPDRVWKPRELVDAAVTLGAVDRPGHAFHYTNTSYVLLGMVLERVEHRSIRAIVARRLLRPLRLKATSWPTVRGDAHIVHGYTRGSVYFSLSDEVDTTNAVHPSLFGASGAMISNASDLDRFLRALLGGRLIPRSLLRYALAHTVKATGRTWDVEAIGLAGVRGPCSWTWGGRGDTWGYQSWTFGTADGRRTVTLLVNARPGDDVRARIIRKLYPTLLRTLC